MDSIQEKKNGLSCQSKTRLDPFLQNMLWVSFLKCLWTQSSILARSTAFSTFQAMLEVFFQSCFRSEVHSSLCQTRYSHEHQISTSSEKLSSKEISQEHQKKTGPQADKARDTKRLPLIWTNLGKHITSFILFLN